MSNLTTDALISQGEDQVFTIVEGEAVLMSIENGRYFKLDDIATDVAQLIRANAPSSKDLAEICGRCTRLFARAKFH